jgi:hypothetical protein
MQNATRIDATILREARRATVGDLLDRRYVEPATAVLACAIMDEWLIARATSSSTLETSGGWSGSANSR